MLSAIESLLPQISAGGAIAIVLGGFIALVCFTRVHSTIAYRNAVTASQDGVVPSPLLPYWIPWFGHTLRFLEKGPNRWYHRQRSAPLHGVFSIIVAGQKTHIVTNPASIRHLFRHAYTKGLTRETFVQDLLVKCLLVSPHDTLVINTGEGRKMQEDVFHKYLARREAVNELTSIFSSLLVRSFEEVDDRNDVKGNIRLHHWLRKRVYSTSLTAFFGEEPMKMYPEICDDIFHFDDDLCTFFFDFPRVLNRSAWTRRQRILENLMKWDAHIHELSKGAPEDPTTSDPWEPIFGSRFNKARMRLYDTLNLSMQSRAGMNLSIMFALASNVVPAITWMMFHLLAGTDNQSLLRTVRGEIDMATKPDGSLDVPALLSAAPLLQSMWTEVLRHYCDNMVMREVVDDAVVPLDDHGARRMVAKKGEMIISPCWVPQHDAEHWKDEALKHSPNFFIADRFVGDQLTSAKSNALAGLPSTKMYPFGGGKSVCAGRVSLRLLNI